MGLVDVLASGRESKAGFATDAFESSGKELEYPTKHSSAFPTGTVRLGKE